MKSTFIEAIDFYASKDLEFDAIIGDEEMPATYSFCGKPTFTDYCMEKYGELLNAECEIRPDKTGRYTDVIIVDYPYASVGMQFTRAWAGYVSETEYDKLFYRVNIHTDIT